MDYDALLPAEIEEMEQVLELITDQAIDSQANSDTEITRIYDAIHENGGEVYCVANESSFMVDTDYETFLSHILQNNNNRVYLHVPNWISMGSPEIHIREGMVVYFTNIPWLKNIIFA